jgi:hypothetical protein
LVFLDRLHRSNTKKDTIDASENISPLFWGHQEFLLDNSGGGSVNDLPLKKTEWREMLIFRDILKL